MDGFTWRLIIENNIFHNGIEWIFSTKTFQHSKENLKNNGEIMKIKSKIYIQASKNFDGTLFVEAFTFEMADHLTLKVEDIEIDVPDLTIEQFNSRAAKEINERKQAIMSEAKQRADALDYLYKG